MALTMSMTALAGQWQSDANGWWYRNDDGSYPNNAWNWIDGNNDGIAESYYFNEKGYCLMNTTTPDGYTVNPAGAWVIDGVVQTKQVGQETAEPEQNNIQSVNLLDLTPSSSSGYNKFENKRTIQGDLWSKGFYLLSTDCWSEFYAGGNYTTFTATVGVMQSSIKSKTGMTIEIYGDNDTLLDSFDLDLRSEPIKISIDITGQNYIKILNTHHSNYYGFAMFKDAQFK